MRKLWTILFFGHLKHLPEKNNLQDSFFNAIFTVVQKKVSCGLVFLLEQSHHWD